MNHRVCLSIAPRSFSILRSYEARVADKLSFLFTTRTADGRHTSIKVRSSKIELILCPSMFSMPRYRRTKTRLADTLARSHDGVFVSFDNTDVTSERFMDDGDAVRSPDCVISSTALIDDSRTIVR